MTTSERFADAVASVGGHIVELRRGILLVPAFADPSWTVYKLHENGELLGCVLLRDQVVLGRLMDSLRESRPRQEGEYEIRAMAV